MKSKYIVLTGLVFCVGFSAEAQLLKKLKEKAQQAVERTVLKKTDEVVTETTESTIDGITGGNKSNNDNNSTTTFSSNEALTINAEDKKKFFKEDVIIKMHENGNLNQTQYFDADAVAVRTNVPNQPKPMFIDSEGFIYGYKDGEYTKSSIVALQSQGMMVPTMMLEAYKLPPEPFMAQLQKQHDLGMTANPFNGIVEFAFIYKPDDFRYKDFKETKQTLRGNTYTKFEFLNDPGYEDSYVLFDDQDRLIEIYTNKADTGQSADMFEMSVLPPGESLLLYDYQPVDVQLPEAREVKAQGQGLMEAVMGGVVKGGNSGNKNIDDDDYDTSDTKGMTKSIKTSLKNYKVTANDLPESYDFDWIYQTEMLMGDKKKEKMDMEFLIKEGANYQATKMIDEKNKDMGNATMLFDSELNTMVMFMEAQGNKMLQLYPIPEVKNQDVKTDYKITDLPSKTILNYTCNGLQMENDKYIIKVYHTKHESISLGNFLNFGGSQKMNLPDIDSRILEQFSNGLIMEMDMVDKKKSKNNMNITAKSLSKQPTKISKNEYQVMNFFSGASMMNKN
ncbi:hypothetical protein [Aestuariibaculum marinum]|uniref:DUF4412 domain-containing protein n=1 Tax=Aestuariibaculum marinum TaxID=2683592 RepID=A0A8J6PTQ0_9FLAO|nr:hypothetical protein [Aestuariibaculum marinum]MBD0823148.1 hypothetical protein [Aestuariibaculum marinum]